MSRLVQHLWLVPLFPLVAAAFTALLPRQKKAASASAAIAGISLALIYSAAAFAASLKGIQGACNLAWFQVGVSPVEIGWVLYPLTSVMIVMVSFVSLLIFIYSTGYMREDPNYTRFFCFLSLFAAAMLGVVIANSLLLLFICWELVGLASYLLIGFWFQKPSAAAAAKKAFITTRIGDLAFLIGMVWLFSSTGTLLFYDNGRGILESHSMGILAASTAGPVALSTAIGLLLFTGAMGKSGQIPLHVWLPDAMEGPTPVSALIHAATMVAAGVFLVARLHPLLALTPPAFPSLIDQPAPPSIVQPAQEPQLNETPKPSEHFAAPSAVLKVITWIGVLTALFAASIAVAQYDIKRILAYSTVSQLGFMMMALGTGGVAAGMFHLITHAFFKALLFLGAGSVIHGCHEEQDIRNMGALRKWMPVTFAVYAIGMLALSGFPLLFSGFWSKDAILHSALHWPISSAPFCLGLAAALLTAFYMTRQVIYVFYGAPAKDAHVHESPAVMLVPLIILAAFTLLLSLVGTPAWPWFENLINGHGAHWEPRVLLDPATLKVMGLSSLVALGGICLGIWIYRGRTTGAPDWMAVHWPQTYTLLNNRWFIDEIYEGSVIRFARWFSKAADRLDREIISGIVELVSYITLAFSWASRLTDEWVVNKGFDEGCQQLGRGGRILDKLRRGGPQSFIRFAAAGILLLALVVLWGLTQL